MLLFMAGCLFAAKKATPEPETCADRAPDQAFDIDGGGSETMIHSASAFDGEGVWVVWSEAHEQQFQVWASRISCGGGQLVGAFRIDDGSDDALDPAVTVSEGRVLVAWQVDNGMSPENLAVITTVLDSEDGAVLQPPTAIPTPPRVTNFWMPSVAPANGGFFLAGAAGIEGNFRVVTTRLDLEGEVDAAFDEPLMDAEITQTEPEIASDGNTLQLVFDGSGEVFHSAGGSPAVSMGVGSFPAVGVTGRVAFAGDGDLVLGPPGALVHESVRPGYTAVAGDYVAWHRNVSGLDNEMKVARFDSNGLGERIDIGDNDIPPYGFDLTLVAPDVVFVAYQTGDTPNFQLHGRFVRLEE